ncbi:MAG: DUF1778 domain-containing protein [Gammaproteobacteria bacterium]|nr:DUF1778 domain-containing protein [Gammaproteobacteria bacterium]
MAAPLQIRIKDEQRELIARGAKISGEGLSEFVRRAACTEAEYLEQDRSAFSVDAEKYSAFLDALDAAPEPNEALSRLLHSRAPWD